MQTLATSYAVNARSFMVAMKKADPAVRIGVPWDFDPSVLGSATPDNAEWNDTVLGQDGPYVSFVDAHCTPPATPYPGWPPGRRAWTGGT